MTDATVWLFITLYLYLKTTREDEEWVLWHIDYESAFLNANLDDKEVYIE